MRPHDSNPLHYELNIGPSVFEESKQSLAFREFCDKFPEPRLGEFYAYWAEKWEDGRFPRRSDIDPTDIPQILPYLLLVDPERGARLRFRYRLMGAYLAGFGGIDFTGKYLDELPLLHIAEPVERCYALSTNEGRLTMLRAQFQFYDDGRGGYVNKGWLPFVALVLPLFAEDKTVNMLIVMVCPPPEVETAWMAERRVLR